MNPTLYDILGVSEDATREEIRKAWRDAADRFEPGEGGSTKQFRLFNEAAEVLLDPERRKAYDEQLAGRAEKSAPRAEEPATASPVPAPPIPGAARVATPGGSEATRGVDLGKAGSGKAGSGKAGTQNPAGAAAAASVAETEPERKASASPGEPAADDTSGGRGWAVPWPVFAVLGVLTALAVGFAAYFLTQAQRAADYREALDRAPAAAESAAAAVLSYDYKSLEADRDAAAKFLSGGYRSEYVDTFDKLVAESATETKATVEADVLASSAMVGGEDRNPNRVPVLLYVNQTTTSTANEGEPPVALNRVRFDMVKVDGTWLVDGITSY
jgi:Mce-associated membrane protein